MPAKKRIPVTVLGATGAVGQRFVQLLDNHPWFEVVALTGSDRAIGQKYQDACHWILTTPMPHWARELTVIPTIPLRATTPLAFSALPNSIAREAEPLYAQEGVAVCSNASAYRQDSDIPLVLPEINPNHMLVIDKQRSKRKWTGCIVTNSNCTIAGATVALKPLLENFDLQRVFMVSMQAISGAGYPGVPSLDILGNVVPFIGDEEEKMEYEPRKILGSVQADRIEPDNFQISAQANRVPVLEGHMVCLSVELVKKADVQEIARALQAYQAPEISRNLPSAPDPVIQVRDEPNRPQPRLDVMTGEGMTTVVGRLRADTIFDLRMVVLSHNTIRGAAGGSIYNAELLIAQRLINTDDYHLPHFARQ